MYTTPTKPVTLRVEGYGKPGTFIAVYYKGRRIVSRPWCVTAVLTQALAELKQVEAEVYFGDLFQGVFRSDGSWL